MWFWGRGSRGRERERTNRPGSIGTIAAARGPLSLSCGERERPRRARGVSGGEARRASVAAELLGAPPVLLLDEPTSRLDARAALRLVQSLRRVARGNGGVAVLATMHQPRIEIFDLLDRVSVVADGAVAWRGSSCMIGTLSRRSRARPRPAQSAPRWRQLRCSGRRCSARLQLVGPVLLRWT